MTTEQQTMLHKEIDLIEGVIERMARNSFMIKGWTLSMTALVSALSSLSLGMTAALLLIPVVCFWWLDAYYLRLEKAFRKVYEDRIECRSKDDWSTNRYLINCGRYLSQTDSSIRLMWTSSTFPFYGAIVALLVIMFLSQFDWLNILSHFVCTCRCSR